MKMYNILICSIIVIVAMALSSCSSTNGESQDSTPSKPIAKSEIEVFPSTEIEPSEECVEISKISETLGFTLDDVSDILAPAQELGKFVSYATTDFKISKTGSNSWGTVCFSTPSDDEIGIIYFLTYAGASSTSFSQQAARNSQAIIAQYCAEKGIDILVSEHEDGSTLVFSVAAKDCSLITRNLPISLQEFRAPNEFLASDERRETCSKLLRECRYSELYDYISAFIDTNTISENDIVFELQAQARSLSDFAIECEISTDNIEDKTSVYFCRVNDITDETNVIPFLTTSKYGISMEFKLGFNRNQWLFFDQIIVASSNGEPKTLECKDVNRDILGGPNIQEYVYTAGLNTAFTSNIVDNEITVRFKNTDTDEVFDHALTEHEISAISVLDDIWRVHTSLYYSISSWKDM